MHGVDQQNPLHKTWQYKEECGYRDGMFGETIEEIMGLPLAPFQEEACYTGSDLEWNALIAVGIHPKEVFGDAPPPSLGVCGQVQALHRQLRPSRPAKSARARPRPGSAPSRAVSWSVSPSSNGNAAAAAGGAADPFRKGWGKSALGR